MPAFHNAHYVAMNTLLQRTHFLRYPRKLERTHFWRYPRKLREDDYYQYSTIHIAMANSRQRDIVYTRPVVGRARNLTTPIVEAISGAIT